MNWRKRVLTLCAGVLAVAAFAAELPPVKVSGGKLVAAGARYAFAASTGDGGT